MGRAKGKLGEIQRDFIFDHMVILMNSLDMRDLSGADKDKADLIVGWKGDAIVILKDRKNRPIRSITRGQYERLRMLAREKSVVTVRDL